MNNNQLKTEAIILKRIDYGEADRIITLLTPEHGKVAVLARGVRKIKSKLAGGIELFSVSDITYMRGRGELGTLVSTRLKQHYGHIVNDIERVQLGYEIIKLLDRVTEDQPEVEYFELLHHAFVVLDDISVELDLIRVWFHAQLLQLGGHMPNLVTDKVGNKLDPGLAYTFDFDSMAFGAHPAAPFTAGHIKTMRLLFSATEAQVIARVEGLQQLLPDIVPLVHAMRSTYLRI